MSLFSSQILALVKRTDQLRAILSRICPEEVEALCPVPHGVTPGGVGAPHHVVGGGSSPHEKDASLEDRVSRLESELATHRRDSNRLIKRLEAKLKALES